MLGRHSALPPGWQHLLLFSLALFLVRLTPFLEENPHWFCLLSDLRGLEGPGMRLRLWCVCRTHKCCPSSLQGLFPGGMSCCIPCFTFFLLLDLAPAPLGVECRSSPQGRHPSATMGWVPTSPSHPPPPHGAQPHSAASLLLPSPDVLLSSARSQRIPKTSQAAPTALCQRFLQLRPLAALLYFSLAQLFSVCLLPACCCEN